MKIALIGEYSRLHNSLKEGLQELGHEVLLVGMGDDFKKFPTDLNYDAKTSRKSIFNIPNKICIRLFGWDLSIPERGIRFWRILPKLKDYDVVQLINETPVQTFAWLEKIILKKLIKQNKKIFLLSCGADHVSIKFMVNGGFRYGLLDPYFEDKSLAPYYAHSLKYLKKPYQNISKFLYDNVNGVIASDFDYVLPLQGNPKFLGLIPNPINTDKLDVVPLNTEGKIVIFLGINRNARYKKGIPYFEKALEKIKERYSDKVEVVVVENLPYAEYINVYNRCHILLDQIYSYDQGYNALEAMAKGKVVFTGVEKEFREYFGLQEDEIAINALPDVNYLVEKLSYLIENPNKIFEISKKAKEFILQQHFYIDVSKKYIKIWNDN
jgi:glycosyltransferase involved in cell wall biosynthesis